jgi:hypothetical protein
MEYNLCNLKAPVWFMKFFKASSLVGPSSPRAQFPQRLKAAVECASLIAAVNRCATQNQMPRQLSPEPSCQCLTKEKHTGTLLLKVATPLATILLIAMALVMSPTMAVGQHGGGGHGAPTGGGGLSSVGRPDGVDEKDELKDFHHAMDVQATSDQAAAFRKIAKNTEAASAKLVEFAKQIGLKDVTGLEKESAGQTPIANVNAAKSGTGLDGSDGKDGSRGRVDAAEVKVAVERVRTETKNFMDALSARQKSGLKEITGKVAKAEAELAGQEKTLEASTGEAGRVESLAKALMNFRSEQDQLAQEMGIVLSDAGEPAFRIPQLKTSAEVGGQKVAVTATTTITRVSGENGENVYKIEVMEDLGDLQSNFNDVLRAQVNAMPRCGERVEVRETTMDVAAPVSVVDAQIYVERWVCTRMSTDLVAQGNARVEVKVTPVVDANGAIGMKTELGRVAGDKFVTGLVTSDTLGDTLREKIAAAMVTAMKSADFGSTLPPAGAAAAKAQSARFASVTGGNLGVIVDGEMKIVDEQAATLAKQLKERVAAKVAQ